MSRLVKPRQLQCFIAVAELLNCRQAAERLCMTQPPLSRQIQQLEAVLGRQLFERDTRGVRMTEAGEHFLAEARALLQQAENVLQHARQQDSGAVLRIGMTTVVDSGIFPDWSAMLAAPCPGVRLAISRQLSIQLIRQLRRGELDVALIGLPSLTNELVVEKLFDDPLMLALPAGHPLAKKRQVRLADLQGEALFWFGRALNPAYYDFCQPAFQALPHPPRFVPEPPEHHILLAQVAAGQGGALIPRSLRQIRRSGVVYRRFAEGELLSIGVGVGWRQQGDSPLVQAFVQCVRQYFADGHTATAP
ncbi:MAG: LysR family transcriptional regulator [Vogesella sp.]|uniref:LysR family transcriptional regulator n=1 Tax=Vogesella sp. TaxID=1904252 RepID=UPI003F2A05D3